jgi:hypothetical protein
MEKPLNVDTFSYPLFVTVIIFINFSKIVEILSTNNDLNSFSLIQMEDLHMKSKVFFLNFMRF